MIENRIRAAKPNFLGFATSSKPVLQMLASANATIPGSRRPALSEYPEERKKNSMRTATHKANCLLESSQALNPGLP